MIARHCINGYDHEKITDVHVLIEKDLADLNPDSRIDVDRSELTLDLRLDGELFRRYEVSLGRNNTTPVGDFKIIEKWENPYYKKNGRFFIPGSNNPIGKYLLILYNPETDSKINCSIHGIKNFIKGHISDGCVRMQKDDLAELFLYTCLGSDITIR